MCATTLVCTPERLSTSAGHGVVTGAHLVALTHTVRSYRFTRYTAGCRASTSRTSVKPGTSTAPVKGSTRAVLGGSGRRITSRGRAGSSGFRPRALGVPPRVLGRPRAWETAGGTPAASPGSASPNSEGAVTPTAPTVPPFRRASCCSRSWTRNRRRWASAWAVVSALAMAVRTSSVVSTAPRARSAASSVIGAAKIGPGCATRKCQSRGAHVHCLMAWPGSAATSAGGATGRDRSR